MKEEWLQYLWKMQQFSKKGLKTTCGKKIKVVKVGKSHAHGGPDFLGGKVRIGEIDFCGDIEVHIKSSDWYAHKHHLDNRYNSVVLHVVWTHNKEVMTKKGTVIPTLALAPRTPKRLLDAYYRLMTKRSPIPCHHHFLAVKERVRKSVLETKLLQRLDEKYLFLQKLFRANNKDTHSTTYQLLGYNFGFKSNSEAFLSLVQKVPLPLVQRYRGNLIYLEALLMGQAGLLPDQGEAVRYRESYEKELIHCYHKLKEKHPLEEPLPKVAWHFARLRPANFPTIRMMQFARFIHLYHDIFSLLINSTIHQLRSALALQQSTYWQKHYLLGKKSNHNIGGLGQHSIENIIINTVVPLLVMYGKVRKQPFFAQKAVNLLRSLPPEDNSIVRAWQKIGFQPQNAFESQAVLALFKGSCKTKQCLQCDIGKCVIKASTRVHK